MPHVTTVASRRDKKRAHVIISREARGMKQRVAGSSGARVAKAVILAGVVFAAAWWVVDSAVDVLGLRDGYVMGIGELVGRSLAALAVIALIAYAERLNLARKRVERELSASISRSRELIEHVPIGVYRNTPGPRGRFLVANSAIARMFGCESVAEFMRIDVADLYAFPSDRQAFSEKLAQQGKVLREEIKLKDKNGRVFWGAVTASAVRDSRGEVEYFDGVIEDITARKEAEEALKESSAKYQALFECSTDAVMLLDRDGFLDCNSATLELFGFKRKDEFIGKHPSALSPEMQPDGKDSFIAAVEHIERAYENGSDFFDWMHRRQNGTLFPATVRLSLVKFNGREMLQALVRDISELKWMEKAIADEKELLDVTLKSIGDAVVTTNLDGCVTSLNKTAEALTGWREHDALGLPVEKVIQIVDEDTRERRECPVHKAVKSAKTVECGSRVLLISKDGTERNLGDSAAPVRDRDGNVVGAVMVFRDISEKRHAERALEKRTEDLRRAVRELDCLYSISRIAEMRDVSLEDIFRRVAEVIRFSWRNPESTCARLVVEGREFATDNFEEGGRESSADIIVENEKIGCVQVYQFDEPAQHEHGEAAKQEKGLLAVIADRLAGMIERVRSREAAEAAARQWSVTFDAIQDMVVLLDQDFRVIRANRAVFDAFPEREVIGVHCYELFHGSDSPVEGCPTYQAFQSRKAAQHERFEASLGGRWISISAYPVEDDDGQVQHVVHTVRDITEHRRAEDRIRESDERYRALFNAAVDGILIADIETKKFVFANQAICKMLGYSEDELPRLGVADIHPKDALPRVMKEFEAQGRGEKSIAADIPCLRKDGTVFHADVNTAPATIDGRKCNIGFFRDITDRKRMEREFSHDQKLKAVGQLAAGIAHEINTPTQYVGDNLRFLQESFAGLNNIIQKHEGLLQAGSQGGSVEERVAELKAAVEEADLEYLREEIPRAFNESLGGVERVTTIVRAMKEFSHPGSAEKSPADINSAIESTITVARNEWKYVAEMETDFDPDLPHVPCVIGDFNQVVLNMIVNSAHAVKDVVGDGGNGKGKIKVTTRKEGDWAVIRISDTGAGIPQAIRSRVFDPFFTTKEVGKGTGQGLAIAHDVIVTKHGGSLTFDSEEGKGTTFVIRLPLETTTA